MQLEDCMEVLKSLPTDLGEKIGNDIVTLTLVMLNHTVMIPPIKDEVFFLCAFIFIHIDF